MQIITIDMNSLKNSVYGSALIRQGENLASTLQIKLSEEFIGYQCHLLLQLNNHTPVATPILTPNAYGVISFSLTNALTNEAGRLKLEIVATNEDGVIMKSALYTMEIKASIDGTNTEVMPAEYAPWYIKALEEVNAAKALAVEFNADEIQRQANEVVRQVDEETRKTNEVFRRVDEETRKTNEIAREQTAAEARAYLDDAEAAEAARAATFAQWVDTQADWAAAEAARATTFGQWADTQADWAAAEAAMVAAENARSVFYEGFNDKIDSISTYKQSDNLLNVNDPDYAAQSYVSATTGIINSNSIYDTTGFIKVTPGRKLFTTNRLEGAERAKYKNRGVAAYNAEKQLLSTKGVTTDVIDYLVPDGVSYVRITIYNSLARLDKMIVEVDATDESFPPYEPYYEPYYEANVLTDKTLSIENKAADAKSVGEQFAQIGKIIEVYKRPGGRSFVQNLLANESIAVTNFPEMIKIGQSFSYSAKFPSFSSDDKIIVGFVNSAYHIYQGWMEISFDRVKWITSGTTALMSELHGLTLSDYINLIVEILPDTGKVKVVIATSGGVFSFTQTIDSTRCNASGTLLAKATMSTSDVVLSGGCTQFKCDTWIIGDSYMGYGSDRIAGRLVTWGIAKNALIDGIGGFNSQRGYTELQKLLEYGTPKTLVWYLGMNDNAGIVTSYYPLIEQLCDAKGIELVYNRIPFVPSRLANNAAVNNYVMTSGRRYIDSYSAVGSDENGNWYSGHLNVDGVHPDGPGAAALTSRLIADVPEIMSAGI